jgi:GntR family transcriptional regulator
VHRLRLGNKLPLAVERAFFPAYCFPNPPDCQDLERRSLYAILREEAGINLEQAVQSLESRAAQPDEAKLLDISVGTPLMFVERVSYDDKQRVIEYGTYFFRGDCVRFVSHSTKPDW